MKKIIDENAERLKKYVINANANTSNNMKLLNFINILDFLIKEKEWLINSEFKLKNVVSLKIEEFSKILDNSDKYLPKLKTMFEEKSSFLLNELNKNHN
jgi:hypothetical protein